MDELHQLLGSLQSQVTDPNDRAELAAMAVDATMLPVRIARGEDVSGLTKSLAAEGKNRALQHRGAVQAAVSQAWQRAVARIVGGLLSAAATA